MKKLFLFLASGGGIGYLKPFPGGFGALEGFLISWLLFSFSPIIRITIIILTIAISFFIADKTEKEIGHKDPHEIVIDEIVGVMTASLFIFNLKDNFSLFFLKIPIFLFLALLLFIIFDFFKPLPANKVQNLKGGLGVILDDIIAGLYTGICILLLNIIR